MGAGIPPMPQASAEATPSMAGMMSPAPQVAQPDPQEMAKAAMSQFRQLSMTVETLAAQFPVAAPALQVASKALQQAMVLVVSDVNRTQTSPPSPQTLA